MTDVQGHITNFSAMSLDNGFVGLMTENDVTGGREMFDTLLVSFRYPIGIHYHCSDVPTTPHQFVPLAIRLITGSKYLWLLFTPSPPHPTS